MRLTYKLGKGILVENSFDYDLLNNVCYQDCVDKLGELEDIMEKHDINSAEELEHIILNNATGEQAFNDFVNYTVKPFLIKRVNFQTLIPIIEKGWTWEDYMKEEDDRNTGGKQFADERLTETEFSSIRDFLLKHGH